MLTRRTSSALLREASDEETAYEILRAYTYSKIHRGNTRKALYAKLERIQSTMSQRQVGPPFSGAYRRINHILNSARTSWSGQSIVGSLAELQVPSTRIGNLAWEKAVGGPKKYSKMLREAQDSAPDYEDDDEDYSYAAAASRQNAASGWKPQPQPVMYTAGRSR